MKPQTRAWLAATGAFAGFYGGTCHAESLPDRVPGGVRADYEFETSDFMKSTAYRNVKTLDNDDSPSGAYGPVNKAHEGGGNSRWYIEHQRFGGDLVDGGVAVGDTGAITRGLRIIRWGVKQENSDGSFSCPDTYHSTSFFVEASSHAFLMIAASPFRDRFRHEVESMLPAIHRAARWMARRDVYNQYHDDESPFTHRFYLDGAAIGEAGVLCSDRDLVKTSHSYVEEGRTKQDPSGFNPEKGGYDSSYNALGTFYALRYYNIVADDAVRARMYPMLDRAIAWEATRVQDDGRVGMEGNSRVAASGGEHDRAGAAKKVAVGQVFRSFYYWSRVSGQKKYADLAGSVAKGNHMAKG